MYLKSPVLQVATRCRQKNNINWNPKLVSKWRPHWVSTWVLFTLPFVLLNNFVSVEPGPVKQKKWYAFIKTVKKRKKAKLSSKCQMLINDTCSYSGVEVAGPLCVCRPTISRYRNNKKRVNVWVAGQMLCPPGLCWCWCERRTWPAA